MSLKDLLGKNLDGKLPKSKTTSEPTPEVKDVIIPLLRKAAIEQNREIPQQESEFKFRASAIGKCLRSILYNITEENESDEDGKGGQRNDKDVDTELILSIGNFVHDKLQGYLEKQGILTDSEKTVSMPGVEGLGGHCDGVLLINGERVLFEIKTMNMVAFERMAIYKKIYSAYKMQATVYMKSLGIKKCIFLIVNRNIVCSPEFAKENPGVDQLFCEIHYELEQEIVDELADKVEEAKMHLENGTRPQYKKVSECSYCKYADNICKKHNEEEKLERRETKKAATKANKLGR